MNQNYHCILYGKTPVPKKSLDEARSSSAFDILDLSERDGFRYFTVLLL